MENETSQERKPVESNRQSVAVRQPLVPDVERTKAAIDAFEKLKKEILEPERDYVDIHGKLAITRSGFSKIALAFGLNTEIVRIQRIPTDKDYIVHVLARATAPNGRFAEANASCAKSEFAGGSIEGTISNVETKAATRAVSRSVANLVGGGVLSLEEVDKEARQPQKNITDKQIAYFNKLSERLLGANVLDVVPLLKDKPLDKFSLEEAKNAIDALKKFIEGIERKA